MNGTGTRDALDSEISVIVPNFNDAVLSLVFFYQSIPLLRYDFKRSGDFKQQGYNFNEELLSGMISAILTVSSEIDTMGKSLLRKVDQTSYSILVTMGKKCGLMLIVLKDENEQVLREFSAYLLSEFERRYASLLFCEGDVKVSFDKDMFLDFIPTVRKTAEIPIALSPDLLVDLLPPIRALAPSVNVVICDKLVFMPIFKQISDYITPNELQDLRTFLKEIIFGSSKFLGLVQKFGPMETITLKTAKKRVLIANLDPFFVILFSRVSVPESEFQRLLGTLKDAMLRNLVLSTRQKALLFKGIDMFTDAFPGLDPIDVRAQVINGLKEYQRDRNVPFRIVDQYQLDEKKAVLADLVKFMSGHLAGYYTDVDGLVEKLDDISKQFVALYNELNGAQPASG
ncbi:MAG: hypothetical protein JW839_12500 [Candidatus Lokiarchaeota archaeon]|nr:hypothetical protein [Candidatus Lokiarchaeota archaeon]